MVIRIALIVLLLSTAGCPKNTDQTDQGIEKFDAIIASILTANGLMDAQRFNFQRVEEAERRHYVTTYRFDAGIEKDNHIGHWIAVITVAHAGELIDIASYRANQKRHPTTKEPAYAKRLMDVDIINVPTSYTPRGMFSGLCMTTLDEQFDVRIMASNLLPDNVAPPAFEHDKIGKMILEAYASQLGSRLFNRQD